MLRRILYSLFFIAVAVNSVAAVQSYDKLFAGKKYTSAEGLIDLRLCEGKIYAHIPSELIGELLLMSTVIENTSDIGEGPAGQVSENCVPIIFEQDDSHISINIPPEQVVSNYSGDSSIDDSIDRNSLAGVWKRYEIVAFAPDGAAVVDMSDFFLTYYTNLYTFPRDAYNSLGGQVKRVYNIVKDKSSFKKISANDEVSSVVGDFFYKMDGYMMGMMKISGDFSVRAQVRKMIFKPRDSSPLPPIQSTMGIGASTRKITVLNSVYDEIENQTVDKRMRIEPSDSVAWNSGQVVEPVHPVVFYIDEMVPDKLIPHIRDGVMIWNKSFEKAGFRDVFEVKEIASDSLSASPYFSRIIYAPSGMDQVEISSISDPRTGEIINSSICLNDGAIKLLYKELIRHTAASDSRVRTEKFRDDVCGKLVKLMVMRGVAECLGIQTNVIASAAYPTDSLRSVGFTQKYGIVASVTEKPVFNYIADEDEVAAGVQTIQHRPGPYDEYMISWLYGPDSMRSESRIHAIRRDPACRFASAPDLRAPMAYNDDLGDNIFLSLDYWVKNQKKLFLNVFDWFGEKSNDQSFIVDLLQKSADNYARQIVRLTQIVGGYSLDWQGRYKPLASAIQSTAVYEVMKRLRDMDWFNSIPSGKIPYGSIEFIAEVYRTNVFNTLLARYDKVVQCAKASDSDSYSSAMFISDIENNIFRYYKGTHQLSSIEMVWQDAFITFLISHSSIEPAAYDCLLRLKQSINSAIANNSGETCMHYKYLMHRIDRENNKD